MLETDKQVQKHVSQSHNNTQFYVLCISDITASELRQLVVKNSGASGACK